MDTKKTSGGQPGNKNAQAFQLTRMLEAKLNESDAAAKREIVSTLVDAAKAGERWAVEFCWDRMEGKVANITQLQGADGGNLKLEVEIVGVN